MKDILKKYYLIEIDEYENQSDGITFFVDGYLYYFYKTDYDEEYINYIYNIRNTIPVKLHDFVFNKDQKLLSEKYVLFKLNTFIYNINLNDIREFSIIKNTKDYISMDNFWQSKIDYLEYQVTELSSNTLINNSFDYYEGIVEQIVLFLKNTKYNGNIYLSHKVFSLSSLDFYNPLNITYDLYLRDIASFIRYTNNYDLIYEVLNKNLTTYEYRYFFARLVFPFEYFHIIEKILLDKDSDKTLVNYLNKNKTYEEYLIRIQNTFGIQIFKWLKKGSN